MKSGAVVAGTLAGGSTLAGATKRSATDWVTLGNSGVKVTRLAMGTGGNGGRWQRDLGQAAFTKVVRHAYDSGIRFFESADRYQTHGMVAEALRGIPRDTYKLMTKMVWRDETDPFGAIDRFRKELNTDHLDILLLHLVSSAGWPDQLKHLRDAFSEAKEKKIILAHGASCHGLAPLSDFPGTKWLDVALLRVNHNGTSMDTAPGVRDQPGDVPTVVSQIEKIHAQGTGVIGMKLVGNGSFKDPETRDASIKFVMNLDCVDAATIGMLAQSHVDEAIERMNRHLNA
jgi:predicted aldo/keto reductase-like oxidoreductase